MDEEEGIIIQLDGEKELLHTFIKTYQKLPVLWNPKHPHNSNKHKRQEALRILLTYFRQIKHDATIDDLKRKLNSLRSNFRKEQRKIDISQMHGYGSYEVYTPTSWLYYALIFLNNVSESSKNPDFDNTFEETDQLPEEAPSPSPPASPNPKHPKRIFTLERKRKLNKSVQLKHSHHEINPIATVWARKLANLSHDQRLFAEKAINDVLFEAELGNLDRESVKINVRSKNVNK